MVEQLFINNTPFELLANEPIELVFQSPLFTDIDKITANRTNSISIPLTANNRKAMSLAGIAQSNFAYRKHTAHYYRDGLLLFTGYATLLSISSSTAEFTLTWGNTTVFQKLFDKTLQDLQNDTSIAKRYVQWGEGGRKVDPKYYPDQLRCTDLPSGFMKYQHPTIPADDVMQAIESHTGVSGLSGVFSEFAIPLLSKKTDAVANEAQATNVSGAQVLISEPMVEFSRLWLKPSTYTDLLQLVAEDSQIIHVADYSTLTVQLDDFKGSIIANEGRVLTAQIAIVAVDEDGNNGITLATIPTQIVSDTTKQGLRQVIYTASLARVEVNVSNYSYVAIQLGYGYEIQSSSIPTISLKIIPDINKEQEVIYNNTDSNIANFPLFLNLPEWSMVQLVKNLMKLSGLFAYAKSDTEIGFVRVSDVYTNKTLGIDWSDRVLDNITELSPTFGNLAQENTMSYAEDNTVKGNYSGTLYVNNETLQRSAELLSVDFAPTDTINLNCYIPLYTTNEEGVVEYNGNLTPRVLRYSQQNTPPYEVTFRGMSFRDLAKTAYRDYQTTIRTPRVVNARVYVPSLDLVGLDLTKPIYLAQERRYYAIIQMTTKNHNTAEVELLQLGSSIDNHLLSTNPNHNKLVVIQTANGEWITSLPQLDADTAEIVRLNDRYKVILLREGYARRGKYGKKYDRILGRDIGTHTTRKPTYRYYRGGKKLRIIGAEILVRGAISDNSKSAKRYYGSSSLVSSLGDALILPDVRRNATTGEVIRTKSGRISNTSKDGIMKLYVALYWRDDNGKWLRISNTVQVRGLTEGNLTYWEFSEGNIIGN